MGQVFHVIPGVVENLGVLVVLLSGWRQYCLQGCAWGCVNVSDAHRAVGVAWQLALAAVKSGHQFSSRRWVLSCGVPVCSAYWLIVLQLAALSCSVCLDFGVAGHVLWVMSCSASRTQTAALFGLSVLVGCRFFNCRPMGDAQGQGGPSHDCPVSLI